MNQFFLPDLQIIVSVILCSVCELIVNRDHV